MSAAEPLTMLIQLGELDSDGCPLDAWCPVCGEEWKPADPHPTYDRQHDFDMWAYTHRDRSKSPGWFPALPDRRRTNRRRH